MNKYNDDEGWGWMVLIFVFLLLIGGLRLSIKCSVDQSVTTQPLEVKK